jgi:hypothetical protein
VLLRLRPEDQNAGVLLRLLACIPDPEALACEVQLEELEVSSREGAELCGRLELRDRIKALERAAQRVGQSPHRSWAKFLIRWGEVLLVDAVGQMLGRIRLVFHEGTVDDELCSVIVYARCLPSCDLFLDRLEVSLDSVDPN